MKKLLSNLTKNKIKNISAQHLVYVAIVLVLIFVIVSAVQSRNEIIEKQKQLEDVLTQCEVQAMENNALEEMLNNSDDEYIEQKAREELDYVLPGERVYIVRAGN